jgi:hypothetical protein
LPKDEAATNDPPRISLENPLMKEVCPFCKSYSSCTISEEFIGKEAEFCVLFQYSSPRLGTNPVKKKKKKAAIHAI